MHIWVGTSGYSYPDWTGSFYPPGLRPEKRLAHYCRFFPLVELNFTFYRPPTAAVLARFADGTPPGFQFLVKVPHSISHEQSRRDLPGLRPALAPLEQRGKLAGLLCQFPQSAHYDGRTRGWLRTLATEFAGLRAAVEFRHRSWARPDVPLWLAEHGMGLVAVDVPYLRGLYPRGWVQAGTRAYVRFHSRVAANWYEGDKERYDFLYSDADLNEWIDEAAGAQAAGTQETLFLFNNCHRGQAVVNARRMQELIARRAPQLELVPSFGAPPSVQRSLFE